MPRKREGFSVVVVDQQAVVEHQYPVGVGARQPGGHHDRLAKRAADRAQGIERSRLLTPSMAPHTVSTKITSGAMIAARAIEIRCCCTSAVHAPAWPAGGRAPGTDHGRELMMVSPPVGEVERQHDVLQGGPFGQQPRLGGHQADPS